MIVMMNTKILDGKHNTTPQEFKKSSVWLKKRDVHQQKI
jgi:hypothetical protein